MSPSHNGLGKRCTYMVAGTVTVVLLRRMAWMTLALSIGLPGPFRSHVKLSFGAIREQLAARLTMAVRGSAWPATVFRAVEAGSVTKTA